MSTDYGFKSVTLGVGVGYPKVVLLSLLLTPTRGTGHAWGETERDIWICDFRITIWVNAYLYTEKVTLIVYVSGYDYFATCF